MNNKKTVLLFLLTVFAVTPLVSAAQLTNILALGEDALELIRTVIAIVFFLAIVVFSWGVVKYISAAGDASKIKDARQILWWGILGIFVLAAMFGIVEFIGKAFDIDTAGGGELKPPTVAKPSAP